jgi:hypothetical protein
MASDHGKLPTKDACHFDKLSDELVLVILEKAAEKSHYGGLYRIPKGLPWVSASRLNQLSSVCQRFRKLSVQGVAKHVVWELGKIESMGGAHAVGQTGSHTKSLTLHYEPQFGSAGKKQASASMELLSAVLGHAINLNTFFLHRSKMAQTAEASHHLVRLLTRLPLRNLWLIDTGFSFPESLKCMQTFQGLVDVRLQSTHISDLFLHSLLEQSPKLEILRLNNCSGLNQPEFKSPNLKKLVLYMSVDGSIMTIDAPNLTRLKGVPELRRLHLKAPKLESVSLTGPITDLQSPTGKLNVAELEVGGYNWQFNQVEEVLSRLGASKSLIIDVVEWHKDGESECLSDFLKEVPPTITTLQLCNATTQLYESDDCEDDLQKVRFDLLTYAHFWVTVPEDFSLIKVTLGSCPKLEKVSINLENLTKPIDSLVSKILSLQRAYPNIEMEYDEPLQFVSSSHLMDVAESPAKLKALVEEVSNFDI